MSVNLCLREDWGGGLVLFLGFCRFGFVVLFVVFWFFSQDMGLFVPPAPALPPQAPFAMSPRGVSPSLPPRATFGVCPAPGSRVTHRDQPALA